MSGTDFYRSAIISIHALLAESDDWRFPPDTGAQEDFYPRSPCGERLGAITYVVMTPDFYPRSPCGERRPRTDQTPPLFLISIHALLAESDSKSAQNSGALLRI